MPLPFVQKLLPYARYIKYMRNLKRSKRDAGNPNGGTPLIHPVSFVVGCGRSGTTITGKLLTQHRICLVPTSGSMCLFLRRQSRSLVRGGQLIGQHLDRF